MATTNRRERERAQRRDAIVAAARALAETEGWAAVTVRRIADEIEYSQPVLYSHFADKTQIVAAVAVQGFAELAGRLRAARTGARSPRAAVSAVTRDYLAFASDRPALYEAMFAAHLGIEFAAPSTPEELVAGFTELVETLRPVAPAASLAQRAELYWSTLHGIAALSASGRLPARTAEARMHLVDELVTGSSEPRGGG